MRTTIDSYKARAGRLDLSGIAFDDFKDAPLAPDALRSLRYMHDVEHHTVCYLRDLLLTPAHQDPEITSFLSCWVFEEMWHGEAIARVLEAHGEAAGAPRIAALRHGHRRRQAMTTLSTLASAAFAGPTFVALHMSWGAINEWTTQAGYARLSEKAAHPTLRELLRRIMKQEGSHIDFYASEAARRLADDAKAQRLTRFALSHWWRPVGSGVMPPSEIRFLVSYLFDGAKGADVLERIDRRVDRLPGQGDLHLLTRAVTRLAASSRAARRALSEPGRVGPRRETREGARGTRGGQSVGVVEGVRLLAGGQAEGRHGALGLLGPDRTRT
jgi:hypothetical protein